MKKLITAIAVLIYSLFTMTGTAQNGPAGLSGTVNDQTQKPLEAATISLLNAKDSAVLKVAVSDKTGKFFFQTIPSGRYLISATAVDHGKSYSPIFSYSEKSSLRLDPLVLTTSSKSLTEVAVIGRKPYLEQKADRMVINVDASPSNVGSSVLDVLEKSPGVAVDKDGNISLKGKQNVMIMIDNKPTYLTPAQLASYLKSLPSSAVETLEIMTNPSAKYDAAGNSGIINIKTKKNKVKGFNGSLTLTETQGVYAKPGGSLNMNYRNGKFNVFLNTGYTHWEGFQNLDINRNYLDASTKSITSIFTQQTHMKFVNPEFNVKFGMDFYASSKTTFGFVLSGFRNNENNTSNSTIYLKDANNVVDSIVSAQSQIKGKWRNSSVNLNFRHQFDSTGTEITADADYVHYNSNSDQFYTNTTYNPDWTYRDQNQLTGQIPSTIDIYSLKSDYSHPYKHDLKLEAGVKTSYVSTDNVANYYNLVADIPVVDTSKTNRFTYRENINAAYVNLNKTYNKWTFQAGLRLENTNYSGHQFGNPYTVNNNDSSFQRSYTNLFLTLFVTYKMNEKNQFSLNYGRRIDRPSYEDLNPFLFFLDQYTYQAGNPYLLPQYTRNLEIAHTYKDFLTTTLNYSYTKDFFAETFQQLGHATIVRNGNIGQRQNAGISVSAQVPVAKWWTAVIYVNENYNVYDGILYGEPIHASAATFLANVNNQFKFKKGWSAELSGFYQSKGIEGQIIIDPLGQASAAVSKLFLHDKANIKLGLRDIFYTQQVKGYINFQQTQATFHNSRDSRQVSLSFTYRFGKPLKSQQPRRNTGGAGDEQNRVKVSSNN